MSDSFWQYCYPRSHLSGIKALNRLCSLEGCIFCLLASEPKVSIDGSAFLPLVFLEDEVIKLKDTKGMPRRDE